MLRKTKTEKELMVYSSDILDMARSREDGRK